MLCSTHHSEPSILNNNKKKGNLMFVLFRLVYCPLTMYVFFQFFAVSRWTSISGRLCAATGLLFPAQILVHRPLWKLTRPIRVVKATVFYFLVLISINCSRRIRTYPYSVAAFLTKETKKTLLFLITSSSHQFLKRYACYYCCVSRSFPNEFWDTNS